MAKYPQLAIIILAAGKGRRMKNEQIPKPMHLLNNRPLISYITNTLKKMEFSENQIWIVVHHLADQIKKFLGNQYHYVLQEELDGTAGAVEDALKEIPRDYKYVMVFQSDDSMFYQAQTLTAFIDDFFISSRNMSLMTLNKNSDSLGSVVRDQLGQPKEIWSQSKCEQEGVINKEIVTGAYLFNRDWVSLAIKQLSKTTNNEIGLPYLIEVAFKEQHPATTFELTNEKEWLSVNTPEELEEAEKRVNSNQ